MYNTGRKLRGISKFTILAHSRRTVALSFAISRTHLSKDLAHEHSL